MSSMNTYPQNQNQAGPINNQHLNGAAIVDAQGREIMITEDMILDALRKLEAQTAYPAERSSRN